MAQEIELLFARGFGGVKRSVVGSECLQFPKMLLILCELLFGARDRIEQVELFVGREQRLVIVRAVKIDQRIADIFQDRQRRRRAVDELAIGASCRKCALNNQIVG